MKIEVIEVETDLENRHDYDMVWLNGKLINEGGRTLPF